jgi:hypothetical protein
LNSCVSNYAAAIRSQIVLEFWFRKHFEQLQFEKLHCKMLHFEQLHSEQLHWKQFYFKPLQFDELNLVYFFFSQFLLRITRPERTLKSTSKTSKTFTLEGDGRYTSLFHFISFYFEAFFLLLKFFSWLFLYFLYVHVSMSV